MDTRNTSRSNRNNSVGKGRGSSATRNNISIGLQSSTSSPKPKVVHSPAIRPVGPQQVHRTNSSNSLPSSALFQDIQIMSNQNSNPQPQVNISGCEARAFNPTMNNTYEQISVPNNTAPNLNFNSTTSSPFDSLIALMQQTMRNTQEEFRRELTSIRASIAQIGTVPLPNTLRPTES